jgi:MoxR-like ATPase
LPSARPRVLLIDEIDKGDIDLPNDLLHVFERGYFDIPELQRLSNQSAPVEVRPWDISEGQYDERVPIFQGRVHCREFPFVIMTSNEEREFPPAFLRRCLRLTIPQPSASKLARIVEAQMSGEQLTAEQRRQRAELIGAFLNRRSRAELATDQLLNALYLSLSGTDLDGEGKSKLLDAVWQSLSAGETS